MDYTKITETVVSLVKDYPWFAIVSAVVTLASAIVAMTPTPPADSKWKPVYTVLEILALVVGKAKDTGATPKQ